MEAISFAIHESFDWQDVGAIRTAKATMHTEYNETIASGTVTFPIQKSTMFNFESIKNELWHLKLIKLTLCR